MHEGIFLTLAGTCTSMHRYDNNIRSGGAVLFARHMSTRQPSVPAAGAAGANERTAWPLPNLEVLSLARNKLDESGFQALAVACANGMLPKLQELAIWPQQYRAGERHGHVQTKFASHERLVGVCHSRSIKTEDAA